ncbi:MAG TPA: class I SAM-dependent methyltransferase [Candidatus Eisenbacteria bacterium]|nr:class I SAM-dependent methyltransferase [Candidatus Eisenbacteria bacterium]
MDATGPNAEQITYWNDQSGPKWVARQAQLDQMLAPFGTAVMDAVGIGAGKRVIDVGCGCGDTTLAIAGRVGSSGHALGVDISEPMLARARDRAVAEGVRNVQLLVADAQTHAFRPQGADVVFSRFGVMFFADPTAAFANLRAALGDGGRVGFMCWQALTENPWMLVPIGAAAQHVALPPPPAPGAPGPFAFADRDRVTRILSDAGLRDIVFEAFTPTVEIGGGSVDDAVEFVLQLGPTAAILREAPADALAKVAASMREALAPYATPRGVVMSSAAWIVTARA